MNEEHMMPGRTRASSPTASRIFGSPDTSGSLTTVARLRAEVGRCVGFCGPQPIHQTAAELDVSVIYLDGRPVSGPFWPASDGRAIAVYRWQSTGRRYTAPDVCTVHLLDTDDLDPEWSCRRCHTADCMVSGRPRCGQRACASTQRT